MAEGLKKLGFDVTTGVGGNGVVGVMKNGTGPVIMLRTDMDALPVREATGLSYASKVIVTDMNGTETPVMHACGHDLHMTVWWGTLNTIVSLKNRWKGTIIAVAQPAEERSGGSDQMINDGLYTRFPLPDYALAYHVASDMPAGTIGYCEGPMFAGVTSVDVKIFGVGEAEAAVPAFLGAQEAAVFAERAATAAARSAQLASIQYREGAVDYQRVLDAQRTLLQQQNTLVTARASIATNLIATFKALGGGWEIRSGQPYVPDSVRIEMQDRTNWGNYFSTPATVTVEGVTSNP